MSQGGLHGGTRRAGRSEGAGGKDSLVADLVCFTASKSSVPITSHSLSNAAEHEFAKLCEEFLC